MLRVYLIATLVVLLVGGAMFNGCTPAQEEDEAHGDHPNLVLIMADDLGYGDVGAYGQKKIKVEGKYITSVGGARSYEPALYLVDQLYGTNTARGIASGLVLSWNRDDIPHAVVEWEGYHDEGQADLGQKDLRGLGLSMRW